MKITRLRSTKIISTLVFVIAVCFTGCESKKPSLEYETEISDHYIMRVLLFKNIRKCEIQAKSELTVTDIKKNEVCRLATSKLVVIERNPEELFINGKGCGTDVTISAGEDGIVNVLGKPYRGSFRLMCNIGDGFDIINALSVESYLDGVVGAEMPSYWEAEALKAQAIAARTYSLYHKQKYGNDRNWDVTKTQSTQVYRGVEAETKTVRRAVADTYGQVMTCEYSDGIKRIFPAYYSSVCGGHTEDGINVFGRESFSSLTGVECQYCRKVARGKMFDWPDVNISRDTVYERLCERYSSLIDLGGLANIEIVKKGYLDRIILVRLVGVNGKTDTVRGEDLRIAVDPSGSLLKSAVFKIKFQGDEIRFYDGIGYGHGVGMCQCGAEGMARKGFDYKEILGHYYSGMELYYLDYSK